MASGPSAPKPEEPVAPASALNTMEIRIMGFMNSPTGSKIPGKKIRLAYIFDLEMAMTRATTMREVKDFTMKNLTTLRYHQISLEFWNEDLKDATTLGDIIKKHPYFMMVKCLHLHVIVPDEMFKLMYKTFSDIGMNEEMALKATKSFMEVIHENHPNGRY